MDPAHRDRIAFVRVCSGRFERGMVVTHGRTGKPFATKYAHSVFGQERETIEEAFPGDVVGLVNATDVRVGDTLYLDEPVDVPAASRASRPSTSRSPGCSDTGRFKQFRRGIAQLDEEGVVQVLRDPDLGDQAPMLAAVGPMQFEVAVAPARERVRRAGRAQPHRRTRVARRTDEAIDAGAAVACGASPCYARADGTRSRCSSALLARPPRGRPPRAHPRASWSPRAPSG